jgi:protein phosphatase
MASATLRVPRRTLIALCGPAAAGKSTFAARVVAENSLPAAASVSSDACRIQIVDDPWTLPVEQMASLQADVFRLFAMLIRLRMQYGRPVIADTVNVWSRDMLPEGHRKDLLADAKANAYHTALVVFDIPLEVCVERNRARPEAVRPPEQILAYQRDRLNALMPELYSDGWDEIVVVTEADPAPSVVFASP